MAKRVATQREKSGIDVPLAVVREELRGGSRIRSVRGYVEVRREAGAEKMTFTTIDGLAALLQQLTEDADG